jgi:hypothetical protein
MRRVHRARQPLAPYVPFIVSFFIPPWSAFGQAWVAGGPNSEIEVQRLAEEADVSIVAVTTGSVGHVANFFPRPFHFFFRIH